MTGFQVLVLTLLAVAGVGGLALFRRWASPREAAVIGAVIVLAAVAVANPELTTKVARLIGIRRGADLISYLTTIAMLVGFVMLYARLRRLREHVTVLTRELAIARAQEFDPAEASSAEMNGETPGR